MTPIIMPQVGHDIPTAKIIEWRKNENDPVEKGEVVLVVESDKAAFEVEAEESGLLLKILHREGEEVEVLKPLAYIGRPGEKFDEQKEAPGAQEADSQATLAEKESGQRPDAADAEPKSHRAIASPSARRAARELGVDIQHVKGSGPGNRVTESDVLAAASSAETAAPTEPAVHHIFPEGKVIPFDKIRKRVADKLALSKQTVPHFYLLVDVDMSQALKWRDKFNYPGKTKITITDMIIKACAMALANFERMNAYVDGEKTVLKKNVHIGIATSAENGLLVPVIAHADKKSLVEISETSRKNAEAARRGFVSPKDFATFTITTLGMYSIKQYLPIINPPECGILAVGTVEKRPVHLESEIVVRDMMTLALACDHRAVDGVYAANFLNQIKHYLEEGVSGEGEFRF